MIGKIINLIYPSLCQICNEKIPIWDKNLCEKCLKKLRLRLPPFCIRCGKQLEGEPDIPKTCPDCFQSTPYFDKAVSVFYYEITLQQVIHNIKYRKLALTKDLIDPCIDFMDGCNIGKNSHLVISIPMHPKRLLEREINLSYILAKNIAKRLRFRYLDDAVRKIKNTQSQTGLDRHNRIKNIQDSFNVPQKRLKNIQDKNILIVDDVFTTGSTVNECAKVLKNNGARQIEVVTLARGDLKSRI